MSHRLALLCALCTTLFATAQTRLQTTTGATLVLDDAQGRIAELRDAYSDFHPDARALLDACDSVTRSALHVREPMENWSQSNITLLGDAAHPMVPFMAQGACMAIEDAVVLSRVISGQPVADLPAALQAYDLTRIPRTAEIQRGSLANDWLKGAGNADWVYGYQAWSVNLATQETP